MPVANPHSLPVAPDQPAAVRAYAELVGLDPEVGWQMEPAEQVALVAILSRLTPPVAVEIGSRYGGSLQVLARYAGRAVSLDLDPTCRDRLGPRHPNAEFVTGDSKATFPGVLAQFQADGAGLGFVLIDGDHTAAGVAADIAPLLTYTPTRPVVVLMHDSFNPDVRRGIRAAPWADGKYVHSVDLDFVPGVIHAAGAGDAAREMWGGLALALLLPEPRAGGLQVRARMDHLYKLVRRRSVHYPLDPPTVVRRGVRKVRHLLRLTGPHPQPGS